MGPNQAEQQPTWLVCSLIKSMLPGSGPQLISRCIGPELSENSNSRVDVSNVSIFEKREADRSMRRKEMPVTP